ncbi:MAG: glycoside hydrolase family 99-like domain-containing protein [Bacteroidales bacterium]|nr:glycoside hydrolase family 99-like domain-containing protein [Bacteroidales bacterium]
MDKRIIAINLPQFHPFKENNEWWGTGFTEWTNVTKAKPRYIGHYQPHLPSDTGFYDLRLPEARQLQADLAREHGIYGFCYYHYWFNGKRLMERPVDEILASGEPDFPFMLCWANENWARNWDGGFKDILISQNHSDEDDAEHIRWLCRNVFSDRRYIRISGKPVFAVYRTSLFPDFRNTVDIWRRIAKEEFNTELYIIETLVSGAHNHNSMTGGIDAAMDFQPVGALSSGLEQVRTIPLDKKESGKNRPTVYNYSDYVDFCCGSELPKRCFPCVSPGFDNSPRRIGRTFLSFTEQSPANYGRWLFDALCRKTSFTEEDENLVFINAWNEWAEGNHLEPDRKWGRAYLEETKNIVRKYDIKGGGVNLTTTIPTYKSASGF